jgi:hypothetical protein
MKRLREFEISAARVDINLSPLPSQEAVPEALDKAGSQV